MTNTTSTQTLKPCGTVAAYCRHHRHDEPIDDACRAARNAYQQEYRSLLPKHTRGDLPGSAAARDQAQKRLGEAHPKRLAVLVAERLTPGKFPSTVVRPARVALAREFPEEYAQLRAEERAKWGLR